MLPEQISRTWAGFALDQPRVMGIVNVTPDSFSDGGRTFDCDVGIATALRMVEDGADIIDIGGESTRPGSSPVANQREQDRILPVIDALAKQGVVVSVDTRHASTMASALDSGARIVNDVSALTHDPAAAPLIAARGCPVVLMHMRGVPETMNSLAQYADVVAEVRQELADRVAAALRQGVRREQIALDPGIGFAKLASHSIAILRGLPALAQDGFPLLIGASRKSFIGRLSQEPSAAARLGGSIAAALFAVLQGASILRVHDVRETVQAIRVWRNLLG